MGPSFRCEVDMQKKVISGRGSEEVGGIAIASGGEGAGRKKKRGYKMFGGRTLWVLVGVLFFFLGLTEA